MNDDELNPRNGEGTENTGTDGDNNRPNLGTGSSGPKHPGNGGGKDQYSLGRGEDETSENPPVEGEDEDNED